MNNPDKATEVSILGRIDEIDDLMVETVVKPSDLLEMVEVAQNVHMDESIKKYIVDLVQNIRVSQLVRGGPSPRASIWLYKGSRVSALMDNRSYVIPDDVKALTSSVIPHRIELTSQARADEISVNAVIKEALDKTSVPKGFD